jgi:hypothetical protein
MVLNDPAVSAGNVELANREFIDSQEKRMAMEVISEKIRIGEKDVGNGRMGVRKLLISMTGNESDPRLETPVPVKSTGVQLILVLPQTEKS